jgi:anti-sigma B factor antagonist
VTAPYTLHLQQSESRSPTLVVQGELDLAAKPDLLTCFEGVLATGPSTLNVDLSEVSFIDSAALGVLVDAYHQLRDRDGRLVVTAASPFVRRSLEITGLAPYFLADGPGPDTANPG